MYFEEALRNEIATVNGLESKVFPLSATEGVTSPYVVYISSEGVPEKYFSGYSGTKDVPCELHILNDTYGSLKDITRQVVDKIVSFQDRVIGGTDGVMVYDVTYQIVHEQYVSELFQYLCIISLTVRI